MENIFIFFPNIHTMGMIIGILYSRMVLIIHEFI